MEYVIECKADLEGKGVERGGLMQVLAFCHFVVYKIV